MKLVSLLAAMAFVGSSPASAEGRISILNDEAGEDLLQLCSRDSPPPYDGRWSVTRDQIARLEQHLIEANPEILRNAHITAEQFRDVWVREYAGFTRNGVRYVYGSFGRHSGTALCDGGPSYFGVEFEMPSGRVTHSAHNGMT